MVAFTEVVLEFARQTCGWYSGSMLTRKASVADGAAEIRFAF